MGFEDSDGSYEDNDNKLGRDSDSMLFQLFPDPNPGPEMSTQPLDTAEPSAEVQQDMLRRIRDSSNNPDTIVNVDRPEKGKPWQRSKGVRRSRQDSQARPLEERLQH